jgi:hypothetical protein
MHTHDDDNIPVLEDVIHEYDQPGPDSAATHEKQKSLWDDEADEFAEATEAAWEDEDDEFTEAPAAVAMPDEYPWDEYARDEPVAALDLNDAAVEVSDVTLALPGRETTALLSDVEPGDTNNIADESAFENVDVIESNLEQSGYDEAADTVPPPADDAPSTRTGQIDIDELAQQILRRLMPDLEDYLLDRIRGALETALDDKARD